MKTPIDYTIQMVPFADHYIIPEDGTYLIQTLTNQMKNVRVMSAPCSIKHNKDGQAEGTSVNISNQRVTHISVTPLHYCYEK
jgi:hypothetical protein